MKFHFGLASALLLAAMLWAPFAVAGNMHQSPLLRKNEKRMCANGKPMHYTRTGRTNLYGCG